MQSRGNPTNPQTRPNIRTQPTSSQNNANSACYPGGIHIRIFKRHRTPQEQASKGSRPSPQRAPKYASLGGFSTRSGRLEARRWRAGRSLNLHGAQDWTLVSGLTLMLAMACRHSAQRHPGCRVAAARQRERLKQRSAAPPRAPDPWAATADPTPDTHAARRYSSGPPTGGTTRGG